MATPASRDRTRWGGERRTSGSGGVAPSRWLRPQVRCVRCRSANRRAAEAFTVMADHVQTVCNPMPGRRQLAVVTCLIICETTLPASGIHPGLSYCGGDNFGGFRIDPAALQIASSMLAAAVVDTGSVRTCRKTSGRPVPAGILYYGRYPPAFVPPEPEQIRKHATASDGSGSWYPAEFSVLLTPRFKHRKTALPTAAPAPPLDIRKFLLRYATAPVRAGGR